MSPGLRSTDDKKKPITWSAFVMAKWREVVDFFYIGKNNGGGSRDGGYRGMGRSPRENIFLLGKNWEGGE